MLGPTRDEGGLSVRQLKNAAAEPPNRYDARHVPPTATNSRARAVAESGRRGPHTPLIVSTRGVVAREGCALRSFELYEFHRKPVRCIVTCYSVQCRRYECVDGGSDVLEGGTARPHRTEGAKYK